MINLEEKAGIEVALDDNNKLSFGPEVDVENISIRKNSDLLPVLMNKNLELSDEPAYTMYRNVKRVSDSEKIANSGLRFDLTVMPPQKFGDEFVKTVGHSHPVKPGTSTGYPEIYSVISGTATFIFQKMEDGLATDIIISQVSEGGTIVIPPGYGHVTVNESDKTLVMANWLSDNFQANYSEFEKLGGAAYYIVEKFGNIEQEKNPSYGDLPARKELKPNPMIINKTLGESAYSYVNSLSSLDFLNNPEKYTDELIVENLFE